ncbi:MAG: hypothetical protein CMN30_16700 [Sandaracinus sp.]|mgnify:CR=1 FL=1|nr:hypothetical protein [Sandaracinus sp.]|tara:strand:- start:1795 stop:2016 length:222 start_codon:yes stop_codon:yes gene_type:complete
MSTATSQREAHDFEIIAPSADDAISVSGRMEAVARAKALSADQPRPVRVERADGKVKMEFLSGGMVRYRRRTR